VSAAARPWWLEAVVYQIYLTPLAGDRLAPDTAAWLQAGR